MVDPSLAAAIDSLERRPWSGEAFRHVAEKRDPLSGAGARSLGGRWNPAESFATIYLALDRETVEREFLRLVKRAGSAPEDFLPRRLYRFEVDVQALLDLRAGESRSKVGITDESVSGADTRACQAVGEAAHYLGREGILAPSASGEGAVLAIFVDRLEVGSLVREVDYELWEAPPSSAQL